MYAFQSYLSPCLTVIGRTYNEKFKNFQSYLSPCLTRMIDIHGIILARYYFQSYLSPCLTVARVSGVYSHTTFQSYLSPCLTALETAPFIPSLPPRSSLPPSLYTITLFIYKDSRLILNLAMPISIHGFFTLISTLPAPVDFNPPKTLIASNLSFTNSLIIFLLCPVRVFNLPLWIHQPQDHPLYIKGKD